MSVTKSQLAEWRAACELAALDAEPWLSDGNGGYECAGCQRDQYLLSSEFEPRGLCVSCTEDVITIARTAVPLLIAECERLHAGCEACRLEHEADVAIEADRDSLRAQVERLRSMLPATELAQAGDSVYTGGYTIGLDITVETADSLRSSAARWAPVIEAAKAFCDAWSREGGDFTGEVGHAADSMLLAVDAALAAEKAVP